MESSLSFGSPVEHTVLPHVVLVSRTDFHLLPLHHYCILASKPKLNVQFKWCTNSSSTEISQYCTVMISCATSFIVFLDIHAYYIICILMCLYTFTLQKACTAFCFIKNEITVGYVDLFLRV